MSDFENSFKKAVEKSLNDALKFGEDINLDFINAANYAESFGLKAEPKDVINCYP